MGYGFEALTKGSMGLINPPKWKAHSDLPDSVFRLVLPQSQYLKKGTRVVVTFLDENSAPKARTFNAPWSGLLQA